MTEILKLTEEARSKLDAAVEENFGYVGSDARAQNCLDECQLLEARLKVESPDEWAIYSDKYY